MEVNNKRAGSHHLACLSGLSQAPLITDGPNDKRTTQISAHSLTLNSPTRVVAHNRSNLNLNINNNNNNNNSIHNQAQISITPRPPTTNEPSASIQNASSQAQIFFPPLPPRSSSNLTNKHLTILSADANDATSGANLSSLPKVDINSNAEYERNREPIANGRQFQAFTSTPPASSSTTTAQNALQDSPNQHSRFAIASNSSRLRTPLSVPPKPFPGFFPDTNVFAQQQQRQQQARRSLNQSIALSSSVSQGEDTWQQQDDNYHHYEPIDADDQTGDLIKLQSDSKNNSPLSRMTPLITVDNLNQAPPPPRPRSNLSNASPREWPLGLSNASTERSPSFEQRDQAHQELQQSRNSNSFADRTGSLRKDVSDAVYFCYVSSKSIERANSRSRSYHGQKISDNPQDRHSLFVTDTAKHFSTTSVAELPISPTISNSAGMAYHFRLRELLETESNYVHALEMIVSCFAKPLEVFLKKDDCQLIFGHIRNFHHIHSAFHADLVKTTFKAYNKDVQTISSLQRPGSLDQIGSSVTTNTLPNNGCSKQVHDASPLSSPRAQENRSPHQINSRTGSIIQHVKISSCFLNVKEKFLKYGEYCASLSKAQALLDELRNKNEAFGAELTRCEHKANEGKFKLRDLLSLPMQRILKYHLLLAQLIKSTDSSNEDYQGLKRAHEVMVDIGQYINEVKRDTEAIQIINEIEHSISGLTLMQNTQLIDYGRLITDGFIKIKAPDTITKSSTENKSESMHDTKIKQKRYAFVFDKVILMCKGGVRGYQYKETIVLKDCELDAGSKMTMTDTLSKHATKDKWSFQFNLVRVCDQEKVIYPFFAKTQDMKDKWVGAIQKAMDNIRPAQCRNNESSHDFLMHTFEKATSCDNCGKLLLGLYYQGYRCRTCFTSVHKKCLNTCKSMHRYVNFILNDYPWFCGRMEREQAESLLEKTPHETFLVRVSPKHNGSYVISLNYQSQVKHMRIYVSRDNQLYLSQSRYFKSIVELVSWYEQNSLVESFHMLNAHLSIPYKDVEQNKRHKE